MRRLLLPVFTILIFVGCSKKQTQQPPAPKLESTYHTHADGHSHSHGPGRHHHKSLSRLQQEVAERPEDPALRSQLIHQAIDEKQPEIAIEQCLQILKQEPENEYATSHLATALLEKGDLNKAMHYGAKNLAKHPNAYNHLVVGHIFYYQGHVDKALKMFEKALALEPGHPRALEGIQRCEQANSRK